MLSLKASSSNLFELALGICQQPWPRLYHPIERGACKKHDLFIQITHMNQIYPEILISTQHFMPFLQEQKNNSSITNQIHHELNQLNHLQHHFGEVQELCLETLENILLKHLGENVSMILSRSHMDKLYQQISDLLPEP